MVKISYVMLIQMRICFFTKTHFSKKTFSKDNTFTTVVSHKEGFIL